MANFAKEAVTNRSPTRHVRVYGGAIAVLLALIQIMPGATYADDQPRTDEQDAIRRMNEQIQELQARVKELEARLNGATGSAPLAAVENSAIANAPAEVMPPPPAPLPAAQESQENNPEPRVIL